MLNMGTPCRIGVPESLGDHGAVAIQHEAVQLEAVALHRFEKIDDGLWIDTLVLGQGTGKRDVTHQWCSLK